MSCKMSVWLGVALLGLSSLGLPSLTHAHHSFAMFDKNKVITVKGVVRKIEWTNPHVYVFVEAPDGGATKQYAVECSGTNMLSRMGWKINTVKVGDSVTVTLYPLRDGRPGGLFGTLTLANGLVIQG